MIVVADAVPIIHLAVGEALHVLPALFGRVLIPREVFDEVVDAGAGRPGSVELAAADWVDVRDSGGDPALLALLLQDLDRGEAAAIALAAEVRADMLLIDERAGRLAAERLGIDCGGSLRVLLEARRSGLIPSVAEAIARMRGGGMWLHDALVRAVCTAAGESADLATLPGPGTAQDG